METTLSAFVAQCETLLAGHAVVRPQSVAARHRSQARVYDTPGLQVSAGDGQELEIAVKYKSETGHVTENPVYCRNEAGAVFRTHGEWRLGVERVRRLLAGEQPSAPITIGLGANGLTVGLD